MVEGRRPTQAQRGWGGFFEEAQPELIGRADWSWSICNCILGKQNEPKKQHGIRLLTGGVVGEFASSGSERSQRREVREARHHGQLHTREPAARKSGLPEAARGPGWELSPCLGLLPHGEGLPMAWHPQAGELQGPHSPPQASLPKGSYHQRDQKTYPLESPLGAKPRPPGRSKERG